MQLVNVYLNVKDPEGMIAFYEKAFGFKKKFAMPGPDGKIMHAEVAHGDCTVMFGRANPEMGYKAPSDFGGSPVTTYVYVKNVDSLTRQARTAGGNVVQEPTDQFWGDRTSVVSDPEGHTWCFATFKRLVPPEEIKLPAA
jgi:PhnB protein